MYLIGDYFVTNANYRVYENRVEEQSLYVARTFRMKICADFRRGESICRLSWKVFADFGGNNPRLSFEGPNLVFQDEINCLDFRYWSIHYISNSKGQRAMIWLTFEKLK